MPPVAKPAPVIPVMAPASAAPASAEAPAAAAPETEGQFPSMESLRQLATQAPPAAVTEGSSGAPELTWTFRGPLPVHAGDVPAHLESPAAKLMAESLAGGGLTMMTAGMECVAREVAHHVAEHQELGKASLHRAIGAACGVSQLDFDFYSSRRDVAQGETEAALIESMRDKIRDVIQKAPGAGTRQAGIWLGAIGQRSVLVIAFASRRAVVPPVARTPRKGLIEVRGQLIENAERVHAMSTRGAYGYAFCEPVPGVTLPAFAFTCPVDAADERAWVSVSAYPAGRFLGRPVALLQVWPAGGPIKAHAPAAALAETAGDARTQLLNGINALRASAQLSPLQLAAEQSTLADQLLPHYAAALEGKTSETLADRITLGMMAGWQVPAMVNDAHTATGMTTQPGMQPLLNTLIDLPHGRAALFDPAASHIAVGVIPRGAGHQAFITTYETVSPEDARQAAEAELETAFQALVEARKALGLPAPTRLPPLSTPEFDLMGRRFEPDELGTSLDTLMGMASDRLKAPIRGWMIRTTDVEEIDFPEEMVVRPDLAIGLVLGYVVEPPEPWARRVIFAVYPTAAPRAPQQAGAPAEAGPMAWAPR